MSHVHAPAHGLPVEQLWERTALLRRALLAGAVAAAAAQTAGVSVATAMAVEKSKLFCAQREAATATNRK